MDLWLGGPNRLGRVEMIRSCTNIEIEIGIEIEIEIDRVGDSAWNIHVQTVLNTPTAETLVCPHAHSQSLRFRMGRTRAEAQSTQSRGGRRRGDIRPNRRVSLKPGPKNGLDQSNGNPTPITGSETPPRHRASARGFPVPDVGTWRVLQPFRTTSGEVSD